MAVGEAEWTALLRDLQSEAEDLGAVLAALGDAEWQLPTPAEGWSIHDQVVHLAVFDDLAALGFTDATLFDARSAELVAVGDDWVDRISHDRRGLAPAQLLDWCTASRRSLVTVLARVGPAARTPWFGPSMSAASSATARLMETWAHGQDIRDTLGIQRPVSAVVRHICHLGVITRGFSYALRGLEVPPEGVRVELEAPDGSTWAWGADGLADRITGPASDFALIVTQRRHIADTALTATPGSAAEWMSIAQAFAGSAGTGRSPRLDSQGE